MQFHETLHVPFLLWIQYDLSLLCSNDNSMSLLGICNWALQQSIIAETTAHNAHDSGPNYESITKFVDSIGLVLDAIINSVNCIC